MLDENTIGEGNEPVQNVVETETVRLAGHSTKVSYTDKGEVLVEIPDTVNDDELETWQKKADNEVKALKSANEKYSSAKKLKEEVSERERLLEEKQAELDRKLAEIEKKLGTETKTNQQPVNLFGYKSEQELNDAFIDNPSEALSRLNQQFEQKLNSIASKSSMQIAIEREGHSFQEVHAFAKSLGTDVNPTVFNTFKQLNAKKPATSKFDNINQMQESSTKFVRGKQGTKADEPDDVFTRLNTNSSKKSLNDV